MEEALTIGIDLGTSNSCVAICRNGNVEIIANDEGNRVTPSFVAFTDSRCLIGDPAKDQAMKNFKNTIYDAKRLIGREFSDNIVQSYIKRWPFQVINENTKPKVQVEIEGEPKSYYPEEILAMILRKMKETAEVYLGKTVKNAVITVPAYFNESQIQAMKFAATISGLNVWDVLNEPTAAAIAYGLHKKNSETRNVLIFDLSSSSLNISIFKINQNDATMVSTTTDQYLGGADFENRMVDHFAKVFRVIPQNKKILYYLQIACEQAKKTLSSSFRTKIEIGSLNKDIGFNIPINRVFFEELNAVLFEKVIELVSKSIRCAKMNKAQIDDVILIGGSSRIPKIQKLLRDFFDGKELNIINLDEAVASGAAVRAAILNGDKFQDMKNLLFMYITPVPLLIKIPNTTVPVRTTKRFSTLYDNQNILWFEVYDGGFLEIKKWPDNFLGNFVLLGIRSAPAGEVKIDVTLDIDTFGIWNVSAVERTTGNENQITTVCNKKRFDYDKIKNMIKEAEKFNVGARKFKIKEEKSELFVLRYSLMKYCCNLKNTVENEKLRDIIHMFHIYKKIILKKCDAAICWLHSCKISEEECKLRQKELEDVFNRIITIMNTNKKEEIYRESLNFEDGDDGCRTMAETPAIGIYLGTTYSCVGVYRFGKVEIIANDQGNRTTPCYVAFTDKECLIGDPAKDQAVWNLKNTIFDVMKLLGRKFDDRTVQTNLANWPFKVISDNNNNPKIEVVFEGEVKDYSPEEILSFILSKMKQTAEAYVGESVKKAVIAVPVFFNDSQTQATKYAATVAGLNVSCIIKESIAVAMAYGLEKKNSKERNVLICDLNRDSFDLSILNINDGVFEVISTTSDVQMGDGDFDNRTVNHFVQEFRRKYKKSMTRNKTALSRLRIACKQVNRTLSASTVASIDVNSLYKRIDFCSSITRARFENLNADLFQNIMKLVEKAISDAKMDKDEIDEVLLVGVSFCIPKVQKLLQDFFDIKKLNISINPEEVATIGAALIAATLTGEKSKKIIDVAKEKMYFVPLSLGIGTAKKCHKMLVMIKRNTAIPVSATCSVNTALDNQTAVQLPVYEGEFTETKFNHLLSEFRFNGITPLPAGVAIIDVTFNIDTDGILNVSAIERSTRNKMVITIDYNRNRLSQNEIERMIKEAENE